MGTCIANKNSDYPWGTLQCKKCSPTHQRECMKVEYMDRYLLSIVIPQKCEEVMRTTKGRVNDYPAMVASCCRSEIETPLEIFTAYSESPKVAGYNSKLKKHLTNVGQLGTIIPSCKNPIGQCAEQHAAEKLLQKRKNYIVKNILFSTAFRPRTSEIFDYCENCIKLFNL